MDVFFVWQWMFRGEGMDCIVLDFLKHRCLSVRAEPWSMRINVYLDNCSHLYPQCTPETLTTVLSNVNWISDVMHC